MMTTAFARLDGNAVDYLVAEINNTRKYIVKPIHYSNELDERAWKWLVFDKNDKHEKPVGSIFEFMVGYTHVIDPVLINLLRKTTEKYNCVQSFRIQQGS